MGVSSIDSINHLCGGRLRAIGRFAAHAFILMVLSISSIAAAQENSGSPEEAPLLPNMERIGDLLAVLEEMRENIDRSQFDRSMLLDRLEYDHEQIIAFARDEIAFEAYAGSLRGADGTLTSRAANDLDQAIFLAAMLNDAAFDARIVEGEINADEASRLVSTMADEYEVRSPFRDNTKAADLLQRLTSLVPDGEQALDEFTNEAADVYRKVRHVTDALVTESRANGLNVGRALPKWAEFVSRNQKYYWVQARVGISDAWLDLHPAFGSATAPKPVEHRYFDRAIPEEMLHKFRLTAFVSHRSGGEIRHTPVTTAWERPTANLADTVIRYVNFPDGLAGSSEDEREFDDIVQQVSRAIADTRFFHPMLNGESAPEAQAFDLYGNVIPSDLAASDMAGVFQEMGAKISGAVDVLSSDRLERPQEASMALLANWLRIELISPDGETREIDRYLLTADRDSTSRAMALAREVAMSVEPGRPSLAKHLDSLLALQVEAIRAVQTLDRSPAALEPEALARLVEKSSAINNRQYLIGASVLTDSLGAARVYRPRPAVVASYRPALAVANESTPPAGLDILTDFNYVWVEDGKAGAPLRIDAGKTVELGVAQTMLETLASFPGTTHTANTFLDWDADTSGNTVAIGEIGEQYKSQLSEGVIHHIQQDLSDGYFVVAQDNALEARRDITWWRIHVDTAETLGRNEEGWGGMKFEYKLFLARVNAMVGPAKAASAVAKCHGILAAFKIGDQVTYVGAALAPATGTWGALLQLVGMSLSSVHAALHTRAGYQAFMRRCVIRNIWR